MKEIEIIVSLIGTCLGLGITLLTYFLRFSRNKKIRKKAEQLIKITNILIPHIKEAEKLLSYSGNEKKEYVITKANQFAIENNIPFVYEEVSNKIEELVSFTKNVNSKEKKTWLEV